MEEGCGWLLLIIIIIGVAIAVVYAVLLAVAYALAFLGLSIIIPLDFFGSAFTWLGVSSPAGGWLLYGMFVGGVIGLVKGLRRVGRTSDLWKVYLGATALFLLLFFASYMAYTTEGRLDARAATTTTTTANTNSATQTFTTPSVQGIWTGTFDAKSATLSVASDYSGTMTVGATRVAVKVTTTPGSQQVVIKETRVLGGTGWSLGTNTGTFSSDGRSMSGTGRDARNSTYSWSFTKN